MVERAPGPGGADAAAPRALPPGLERLAQPLHLPPPSPPPSCSLPFPFLSLPPPAAAAAARPRQFRPTGLPSLRSPLLRGPRAQRAHGGRNPRCAGPISAPIAQGSPHQGVSALTLGCSVPKSWPRTVQDLRRRRRWRCAGLRMRSVSMCKYRGDICLDGHVCARH